MNWIKLLRDLGDAGMTQTQIGDRCGVAQSTVSDLSRGVIKSPSFVLGSKLIALHAEVKKQRAKAPAA